MKHNFRYLLFLLLAFLLLCQSAVADEKDGDCKPIRANKNKELVAGNPSGLYILSNDSDRKYIIDYFFGNGIDTVLVYKEARLISTILICNHEVISPWVGYEMNGQQFVDTIDFKRGQARGGYFNAFYSSHVVTTVNLTQNSNHYYNRRGDDSVTIFRYGNGIAAKMIRGNDYYCRDTFEYNPDGILSRKVVKAGVFTYHANGALQSRRFDTVVSKYPVTCVHDYYGNGVIKSVAYFIADTPYHVWQYYNPQGSLTQSIKKRPLSTFKSNYGPVEAGPMDRIYKYIEQHADFPGGVPNYMAKNLPAVLCASHMPLAGTYSVQYRISRDGTASLMKVLGQNAEAISPGLGNLFAAMPRWRPGKKDGVAIDEVWVLPITVRPIE